ncbi:YveK family protein [Oenococcus sicerae]|uniref:YveK family protein n=1 Tax=Oenococcus sicerae TaxID=2203724 RepID=UPI0010BBAFA1|nr:Capsular polysaccharide type 8 biosynthesis protein cap8A [Oenococcus sicerae]
MDSTISYQRLWELFKKNFVLLVVSALALAAIAFSVSKFVLTPKYQSTTALLVNSNQNDSTGAALGNQQADVQLIYTYKDLATRPVILNRVVSQLKPSYSDLTKASIQKMVSISSSQNSQIFSINAISKNPSEARDVANTTANIFKNEAVKLMGKSVSNVSIVSQGLKASKPVSPNTKLITLAGFLLGAFLAVAYVLIKELSDNTYRDTDYLNQLSFNNLGTVNYAAFHKGRKN